MTGPQASLLSGGRLHLSHGPIDLVIGADGAREAAFAAATARFATILEELVAELPLLRQANGPRPKGPTARRMFAAVAPWRTEVFVTPMAAVAGAVAEEILAAMVAAATLARAYVNNGGDIALHLGPGQSYRLAIASPIGRPMGKVEITAESGVRGVATSGRGGRSHSLGIAEAVTVLAPTATMADAAATLIANAVDLPGHPAIARTPACTLLPDSDLGHRPVVTGLGPLTTRETARALDTGAAAARDAITRGRATAAALFLDGQSRLAGDPTMLNALHQEAPAHA